MPREQTREGVPWYKRPANAGNWHGQHLARTRPLMGSTALSVAHTRACLCALMPCVAHSASSSQRPWLAPREIQRKGSKVGGRRCPKPQDPCLDALLGKLGAQLLLLLLLLRRVLRRAEAPRALLVHLGARRHAVCSACSAVSASSLPTRQRTTALCGLQQSPH